MCDQAEGYECEEYCKIINYKGNAVKITMPLDIQKNWIN